MSLKSILSAVGNWISGIFKKGSDILEDVVLPAAIAVTNALKAVLSADTSDLLGHIAGAAGAAIEDKVRAILDNIIPKLQLAQAFKGQDPATILASVMKLISGADPVTQAAFYTEFAGLVAHAFEDGKIDLGEAMALAKYWYDNHPATPATTVTDENAG